ncbi:Mitochondrial fission protein, partial [Massospora cicadina]
HGVYATGTFGGHRQHPHFSSSGLSFRQINFHSMLFEAVKKALEFRRGLFSTLPPPEAAGFNLLDADGGTPQTSKRMPIYGNAFRDKRRSNVFMQGLTDVHSIFEPSNKSSADLHAALDLLHLIDDPLPLPSNPDQLLLEKEVAKIRITALNRGTTQAHEILDQISEKIHQLELQRGGLILKVEDIARSREKVFERIASIDAQLSEGWQAHGSAVTALFQDAVGPYLATAAEGEIKLWEVDVQSGLYGMRVGLSSTQGTIHCLKIHDGILATGGHDHQVHIWNTRSLLPQFGGAQVAESSGPLLSPLSPPNSPVTDSRPTSPVSVPHPAIILKGHTGLVRCLDMDEKSVISGSHDGTMRYWDVENGKLISRFDPLWTMSSGVLKDYRARYWDVLAGRGPHVEGLGSTVGALQFRSRALCSGTADGIIRLWDIRSGQPHRSFAGHAGPVTALQFDATHLVSGGLDHTVKIWDLRVGKVMETLKLRRGITSVQFDPQSVVASCDAKHVEAYERRTFQRRQLKGHPHPTWCLHLGPARRLLCGGQGGYIRLSTV